MLKQLHIRSMLALGLCVFTLSAAMTGFNTEIVHAANPCNSYNTAAKKASCQGGYSLGYQAGKNEANGGTRVSISTDRIGACANGIAGVRDFDNAACKKGFSNGVLDGRNAGSGGGGGGGGSSGGGGGGSGSGGSSGGTGGVNSGSEAGPGAGPEVKLLDNAPDPAADPDADCTNAGCDLIKKYVNPTIRLLSILVSIIAVISIIVGGLQYSSAGNDPQKISSAKDRISKTIIAYVAYLFLAGFLEFLVPGGIFNR